MERSDGRCLLCSICYVTLALQTLLALPDPTLPLAATLSRSPTLPPPAFFLFPPLTRSLARSFVRSFSKLSQVHASPPSYIQQTPSIYSFELDGSKGKVAGCRCVNFSNAELSTSRLSLSLSLSLSFSPIFPHPLRYPTRFWFPRFRSAARIRATIEKANCLRLIKIRPLSRECV